MMVLSSIVNILNSTGKSVGTGFFASPEGYLLTCNHVLKAAMYRDGQAVIFKYANNNCTYEAKCIEVDEAKDLALLQTDEKAESYIPLCDLDYYNLTADSYGFPDGSKKRTKASVHIDEVSEDETEFQLGDANSVTFGFSGAPLIYDTTVIGMIVEVANKDSLGRMTNVAFAVSAKCILHAFPQYLNQITIRKNISASQYTKKDLIQPITLSEFGLLANTYVERTELLDRMKNILEMPHRKKNYVYLSGIGGEGKSELARAYAFREKDSYQEIFWLTCKDDNMPNLMELFSENHYMRVPISKEEVELLDEKSIIIIDNCNHLTGDFLRRIMSETGNAKLIFTTRMVVIETDSNYKEHMLRVASDNPAEFAYKVFEKNLQNREISNDEIYYVKKICHRIGYHPMTAAMLARDLSVYRKNCSFEKFAQELEKGFTSAFPQYMQLPFCKDEIEENKSAYSVLSNLFHDFLSHDFSPLELQVLSLFYIMPFKEHKKDYIFLLLGDDMMNTAVEAACSDLIARGWLSVNGEYLFMHPLIAEIGVMKRDEGSIITDPSFYIHILKNWLVMLPEIAEDYFDIMVFCLSQIQNAAATDSEYDFLYHAIKTLLKHYHIMHIFIMSPEYGADRLTEMQGVITQKHKFKRPLNKLLKTRTQDVYSEDSFGFTAIAEYEHGIDYLYYDLISQQEHLILDLHNKRMRRSYWGMEEQEERFHDAPLRIHLKEFICKKIEVHYGGWFDKKNIRDLSFPDCLLNCDITEIPKDFCKQRCIQSLQLPSNLSEIGESAFEGCAALTGEIDLPEYVEKIGENAFRDCPNITSVSFPNGITEISSAVFQGCERLAITDLPENLVSIGANAFRRCICKEIILPDGLSSIGEFAFASTGLESIIIPSSVVSIGRGAFRWCCFKDFKIPKTVVDFQEINFEFCPNLTTLTIPESITDIRYINFNNCKKLNSFSFPKNIDYSRMRYVGFSKCSTITKLELPEGLQEINGDSFSCCTNLEEIVIPDSVLHIDRRAFFGCHKLKVIKLSTNLQQIADFAFEDCRSLESIMIPDSVLHIGGYAFGGCHKLKEIKLPTNLQQAGDFIFEDCPELETIIIPSTITELKWDAVSYSCWYEPHSQFHVYFPEGANPRIFDSLHGNNLWLNIVELIHPPEFFPENVWEALCRGYLLAVKKNFQIPEDTQKAYKDFMQTHPSYRI